MVDVKTRADISNVRFCAASVEVEVVVSEEHLREVMVGTAVCLTLRTHTHTSTFIMKYFKMNNCCMFVMFACKLAQTVNFSDTIWRTANYKTHNISQSTKSEKTNIFI